MASTLTIDAVSKTYPGAGAPAVRNVTLEIAPDRFVALIGPSGCGKSTVLNIAAGLVTPDAGRVLVGAEAVTGPGPDRGVVFQHYALLPWMTVGENLAFALRAACGLTEPVRLQTEVRAALARVRLEAAADKYPRQLSGGMRQRVGFARALAIRPKVMLLDEPFGALDALTRAHLQDHLLAVWTNAPMTALMVTHDIDEALLLADRVVVMSRGPAAGIARIIDVPFGRPRARADIIESAVFAHLRAELLAHLTHETELVESALLA